MEASGLHLEGNDGQIEYYFYVWLFSLYAFAVIVIYILSDHIKVSVSLSTQLSRRVYFSITLPSGAVTQRQLKRLML